MNRFARVLFGLLAGAVAFVAVTVGVTVALDPYVWPSALVGLPAGATAGVATLALSTAWLAYREERDRDGRASVGTTARLWATAGAVGGFVAFATVGTLVGLLFDGGFAGTLLLVGLPVGVGGAALGGYLARSYGLARAPAGPPA